jgi:hypothetical protein
MPSTYTLIASNVLTTTTASVAFSAIPATFTDLVLKYSARCNRATFTNQMGVQINAITGSSSNTYINGDGSGASSSRDTGLTSNRLGLAPGTDQTANTFNSGEVYFSNYAGSTNKPSSGFNASENNTASTQVFLDVFAGLLSNTAAISSLTISLTASSFVSGSSFYLYGIKNS